MSELITLLPTGLLSFVATLGFAILYNVPRRALLPCAAIGMAGYLLRAILQDVGVAIDVATFFGALLVGLLGTIPAKRMQLPIVLFGITGIIAMIPGIAAYKVLVYLSHGDILGGLQSAVRAGFGVGAIAAGIGTARILTDPEWGFE
ncbi:MAG: threonine/serine exporter family protein [Elainellaceae cyanobacterium]